MAAFRTDFNEQARIGHYTARRRFDMAWSFYPYPPGAPRDPDAPCVSHASLEEMPVLEALPYLAGVLSLPENRNHDDIGKVP